MDDFFSGPARTPLIIRTPFITPFKLVLLFLIYEFCHFQMFSTTTIPHAVKYLVECVLRSKESYIEPEFKDILAKFEEFDQPPQNMALVDSIRSKLARMKYPDNLFQFMTSLSNILDLNEEDGGGNGDYTVLEANSLFGLFARRCRVEFLRYSTQRKAELFEIFRGYITGKAKNKQLVPKQEDAMDEDIKTVYLSVDPIGLDETYRLDGWISDDQVDKFLTQQAENMERTGTTNVSPTTLDRYLDFLQKHAPDLGKIYQVRFLNHIRTYEYEGAVENLHQFYDYCFHHRETPMYQYALLSLGILEAKFKHTQRALMAFDEASIVAREHQDRECLNEVQSWISFLKGKVYDDVTTESDKNEDDGLKNTTYLKTMHQIQRIQDMLKSGKHPIKVFEKLYQCGILAYLKNIDYVAVPHFSTMANAWQQYGSHLLADTYNKMALENEPATMDDLEHAYLQTIDSCIDAGLNVEANALVEEYSKKFADDARAAVKLSQVCMKRYTDDSGLPLDKEQVYLNRQIEQMTYLQGQQDHQSIDTQIRFAEKQLKQDMDHVAFEILQGLLELTEDDHAHHTKCLILLSQIFLKHGQTKRAIVTLEAAMDLAKKNFNARNYYWAAIKLAQAYITLKEKDKATFILESSIPMVYSLGDTALASEMDVVCSSLEALS